jgi:hypothetical protein
VPLEPRPTRSPQNPETSVEIAWSPFARARLREIYAFVALLLTHHPYSLTLFSKAS